MGKNFAIKLPQGPFPVDFSVKVYSCISPLLLLLLSNHFDSHMLWFLLENLIFWTNWLLLTIVHQFYREEHPTFSRSRVKSRKAAFFLDFFFLFYFVAFSLFTLKEASLFKMLLCTILLLHLWQFPDFLLFSVLEGTGWKLLFYSIQWFLDSALIK